MARPRYPETERALSPSSSFCLVTCKARRRRPGPCGHRHASWYSVEHHAQPFACCLRGRCHLPAVSTRASVTATGACTERRRSLKGGDEAADGQNPMLVGVSISSSGQRNHMCGRPLRNKAARGARR